MIIMEELCEFLSIKKLKNKELVLSFIEKEQNHSPHDFNSYEKISATFLNKQRITFIQKLISYKRKIFQLSESELQPKEIHF